jgi:hypothetical protein
MIFLGPCASILMELIKRSFDLTERLLGDTDAGVGLTGASGLLEQEEDREFLPPQE